MLKTALNTNIIPHIWKLANIVSIPKPNKDIDKGTSYRPISLLSVIAKTLEKSLLPYITANILNTPTQHGYNTQHSTVTALHTLNNTVENGSPCANNHCSTRYAQSFRHNKHTHTYQKAATNQHSRHNHLVHRKLHQKTHSLCNILKLHILTTSIQGGVLSSTLFNIYTADIQPPRAPVQVMAYADDITITSTHTSTSAAN